MNYEGELDDLVRYHGWVPKPAGNDPDHILLVLNPADSQFERLAGTYCEIVPRGRDQFLILSLAGALDGCERHQVQEFACGLDREGLSWVRQCELFTVALEPLELALCDRYGACGSHLSTVESRHDDPIATFLEGGVTPPERLLRHMVRVAERDGRRHG